MQATDDSGRMLDSEFSMEQEGEFLALVLESSGGRTSPGQPPRNADYRSALELLLVRLKDRDAVLMDGLVESRVTRSLPEQERRLISRPIRLAEQSDMRALRLQLSNAQASIGQAPGVSKGGNGSKRIRLLLSVPGYGSGDARRLETDLAFPLAVDRPEEAPGPPPAQAAPSGTAHVTLNEWWIDDPTECYWMEITNRPDVGSNVRALQHDGGGREYWSYALATVLRPGDVVLHWHKGLNASPGIIGYSTAVSGPYDDELIWDARGSYGRQRPSTGPQPAWRYELTGYTPLANPIGQEAFHRVENRLRQVKEELEARYPSPLYFPFAFSENRPLRAMQAYLVKFPAAILQIVPELAIIHPAHKSPTKSDQRTRRARTQRPYTGSGYIADPVLRRAIEGHAVHTAMEYYERQEGYEVMDVGSTRSYDLLAVKGSEELHIEVKGSTRTADAVELTTNEVDHAHATSTDLVVVDQIRWERLPDGTIQTSGGRQRRWTSWRPAELDLRPTRYRYRLPE